MKLRLFVLAATLVAFLAPARAADQKYLGDHAPSAVDLLPAPPKVGSAEDAADLETVVRVHSAAPAEDIERAKDERKLTIFHFRSALPAWFTPGKFPKTEALFAEVEKEAKAATNDGKNHWQRIRPYHADPARVPHAVENEKKTDYSYPSGHSTRGTVFSLLLAELFPEKRDDLIAIGREIGWLRVEGGVHYPSDIFGGRVLGIALAKGFLASPAFQQDLAAAKAELAAAK